MLWLAGLAAMQATSGAAEPGSRSFDLQCMLVTQQAAGEVKDSGLALATQLAVMFYMGRVDHQTSDAQLASDVESAAAAIAGRPLGPILTACGQFMEARGRRMEDIGEKLSKRQATKELR